MPITATLAMVAAAAMAGVPLLNGFLSKEMFFAETIVCRGEAVARIGLPVHGYALGHIQRRLFVALYPQVFRAPAQDLPRAARADTLDAAAERAACTGLLGGRHVSGATDRAISRYGGAFGLGAYCRRTAWPSGMA